MYTGILIQSHIRDFTHSFTFRGQGHYILHMHDTKGVHAADGHSEIY